DTRVIVDVSNLLHRQWWTYRDSRTSSGRDNSIECGLLGGLGSLRRQHPGAEMVLAWDGRPVRQLTENPSYKAQRAAALAARPAECRPRCDRLREVMTHELPTLHDPEDEADVEMARLVHKDRATKILLVSTDKDLFGLLSEQVSVLRPGHAQQPYTVQDFIKE